MCHNCRMSSQIKRLLPRALTIGGETWIVHHCKRSPKFAQSNSVEDAFQVGACNIFEKRIWVRNTGNIEEESKILIHEVSHAIVFYSCESDDILKAIITDNYDLEERLVGKLEVPLWSFLRQNDLNFTKIVRED